MTAVPTDTAERFSAVVRSQTTDDHREAERSAFLGALFRGTLPEHDYADMLAQHWYAYDRLERQAARLADDPVAGAFVDPALARLDALGADLAALAGDRWPATFPASPETSAYVRAIEAASSSSWGFVAHHYTRYLGDLSGGQHIGAVAERHYGLAARGAGNFATFAAIDDPAAYRERYRELLDQAPWTADEQAAFIGEVRAAYRLNRAVFAGLDRNVA